MSAQSVIKNFMNALDNTTLSGTAALDSAVATVSNFQSWSQLISTMAGDCAAAGSGENFLQTACGIILDNSDTGAISGSDAGGSTTKTAESVVPESGSWTYPNSTTFTVNGLTVNVPAQSTLSTSAQWIVGALYTWWIGESLTLINDSFGFNFNESGTSVKELTVSFYNSADGKMAASYYSGSQKSTELQLRINMQYYEELDMSNPNGVGSNSALTYLDRTIAHELVHLVMSANVDWYSNLPVSFKEGAAELVHGIDDKRYSQIKSLSNNFSALSSAPDGMGVNAYAAGYIALRYLAKQAAEGRNPAVSIFTANSTSTTETVQAAQVASIVAAGATFDGVTLKITGATGSDVWLNGVNAFTGEANAYGNAAALILDAAEMTDAHFLAGNANSNLIMAGAAGSTIWGGAGGNDTLAGGSGADNFWYLAGGGNDVALNVQSGDMLSLVGTIAAIRREQNILAVYMADGGTFTAALDDSNVDDVITYSTDGFTPACAKIGNSDSVNDFSYSGDGVTYLGGDNLDALHIFTAGVAVNLGSGNYARIEVLDASTSGGGNALVGDTANNVIISGGNNSALWGGFGDDVIYGGDGADVYFFGAGEGNDTICNAGDDDWINLYSATLGDITFAQATEGGMLIGVGANVLTVEGQSNLAVAFADGSAVRYNRAAQVWTTA